MDTIINNDDCPHSATSARVDLAIDDNGTWSDAFQFGFPDDFTWTLANQQFALDVQLTYYDATPLLSLTSANGDIVVDDIVQRVIHLNVSDTVIQASLTPGQYLYDLVMFDNSVPPVRVPLMHGVLYVSHGITGA